jgi:hypothetical protein
MGGRQWQRPCQLRSQVPISASRTVLGTLHREGKHLPFRVEEVRAGVEFRSDVARQEWRPCGCDRHGKGARRATEAEESNPSRGGNNRRLSGQAGDILSGSEQSSWYVCWDGESRVGHARWTRTTRLTIIFSRLPRTCMSGIFPVGRRCEEFARSISCPVAS